MFSHVFLGSNRSTYLHPSDVVGVWSLAWSWVIFWLVYGIYEQRLALLPLTSNKHFGPP